MKLQRLAKAALQAVKRQISSKYKKVKIMSGDISQGFLNLYDDGGNFVTSVAKPNVKKVFESVIPIDNRKDNYTTGRPSMRDYVITKSLNNNLTINPKGVIGWYTIPYTGPADLQRFLKSADVKGDAMDLSSQMVRNGKITVKIPANRDKHLKQIFTKGRIANPYTPKTSNYIKESIESKGFI